MSKGNEKLNNDIILSLEKHIASLMQQSHVLGLSIGIIKDGNVIYTRGFGAADVKKRIPADPDTLFGIGSVTKSFTALAIMKLAEDGKLDIHDPVSKYLNNFKLGKKKIQLRYIIC